MFTAVTN